MYLIGGIKMKIAIIGANGKVGQLVLTEAINRGHELTAIVRDASKLKAKENIHQIIEKDILDLNKEDIEDLDVVVNAFGAPLGEMQAHIDAGRALIRAVEGTKTRAIIVGGAGSLFVDAEETIRLSDTEDFPQAFIPTAKGQGQNLEDLKATKNLTWTFISPSAMFDPEGKRTANYQSGKNQLLVNSKNESYISYADYAIALVDEIEDPQHINERFTVVGEGE